MGSPHSLLLSGLNRLNTSLLGRWRGAGTRRPGELRMTHRRERSRPEPPPSPPPSVPPSCSPARPSRRQLRAAAPPPWPPGSMAAAVETRRVCETAGCSSEAKLQCPTCLKLGIQGSYFCSQVRFPAAQPLARRSGRAAGAGSSSPRRLPAARARPGVPGSASLPARPGRPGAAAPGQGSHTKFPLCSSVVGAGGAGLAAPGGAGAPFLLVAAGDAGPQRHYGTAGRS